MLKVFATQVVVSRGYDGAAALRFSEKGDSVRFRIGKKVYDPHAENDSRWINLSVKAFGNVCERIKKMQLKEGSFINLIGRLDEDCWTRPAAERQRQDRAQAKSRMQHHRIRPRRRHSLRAVLPVMKHLAAAHFLMSAERQQQKWNLAYQRRTWITGDSVMPGKHGRKVGKENQ